MSTVPDTAARIASIGVRSRLRRSSTWRSRLGSTRTHWSRSRSRPCWDFASSSTSASVRVSSPIASRQSNRNSWSRENARGRSGAGASTRRTEPRASTSRTSSSGQSTSIRMRQQQGDDARRAQLRELVGRDGEGAGVGIGEDPGRRRPDGGGAREHRPDRLARTRPEVVVVAGPEVGRVRRAPGGIGGTDAQRHVGHEIVSRLGPEPHDQPAAERPLAARFHLHDRRGVVVGALRDRRNGRCVDGQGVDEGPHLGLRHGGVGVDAARGVLQPAALGRVERRQVAAGHDAQREDRRRRPGPRARVRVHRADALAERADGLARRDAMLAVRMPGTRSVTRRGCRPSRSRPDRAAANAGRSGWASFHCPAPRQRCRNRTTVGFHWWSWKPRPND